MSFPPRNPAAGLRFKERAAGLLLKIQDAISRRKFKRVFSRRDPYKYESVRFERRRLDLMVDFLKDRTYGRALEVGCAEGLFTERLVTCAREVVALDLSENALERARARLAERRAPGDCPVRFIHANFRDWSPDGQGPFDLAVLSEVLYYLGERNDLFKALRLPADIFLKPPLERMVKNLKPGGRVLLTHSYSRGRRAGREAYRILLEGLGLKLLREEDVHPTGEEGTDRCLVSLLEK